jgi:hypothetical protein
LAKVLGYLYIYIYIYTHTHTHSHMHTLWTLPTWPAYHEGMWCKDWWGLIVSVPLLNLLLFCFGDGHF